MAEEDKVPSPLGYLVDFTKGMVAGTNENTEKMLEESEATPTPTPGPMWDGEGVGRRKPKHSDYDKSKDL